MGCRYEGLGFDDEARWCLGFDDEARYEGLDMRCSEALRRPSRALDLH